MTDAPVTETVPYPQRWVADVLASDGGVVHLRPIRPSDADRLVAFHEGLSERTRYMRYFGPTPTLPPREVVRMTNVDYRSRVAILAMIGDTMIAMGLYEGLAQDGKPESAEVAFVVADEHQGRGLGPILLEHLAGIAAENGFTRFEAEVLSENPNMVAVFRDAGYQLTRSFDGSTVHVEFLIDPTEAQTAVRNARERASEARSVANLLSPQSVAVIGASTDPTKVGNVLLADIVAAGFTGPVFPVNGPGLSADEPAAAEAGGDAPSPRAGRAPAPKPAGRVKRPAPPSVRSIRAYPTVRDIPDPVDLAVIAVPAAGMDRVLDDCMAKGVRTLVIISSGFSEAGAAGLESERRLTEQVRAHGMRLVGPNALGVLNNAPEIALNATLAPRIPGHGKIGFFCQSGALGITILDIAARRELGLSTFVSAGNRADVSGNDLLQYWDTDDSTEVVLLYLESFGNPQKFARIVRRLSQRKPIVAIKSTRGSLSPLHSERERLNHVDDRIAQMLMEQAGVICVDSIAEMFDCAAVLAYQPLPPGPRTAVIGNSSVIASIAADTARHTGLSVSTIVDLGPGVGVAEFAAAVEQAMADEAIDAVIVVFVPPVAVNTDEYGGALLAAVGTDRVKPVVTTFLAVEGVPPGLSVPGADGMPRRGSIPSYATPERAAAALARSWSYAKWRARPESEPPEVPGARPGEAREVVRELMGPENRACTLNPRESAELLERYGVTVVPFREVRSMHEASVAARDLGFPVAVKATSPKWQGRTDREGARLDLSDTTAVVTAYSELQELTDEEVLQVQLMAPKGLSVTIKVIDHVAYGTVIAIGLFGKLFDVLDVGAFASVPLSAADARDMVTTSAFGEVLHGLTVDAPVDLEALIDLLLRVSALVDEVPEIRDVRCEPILCSAEGAHVLTARIRVGPVPSRLDTGPRRLS